MKDVYIDLLEEIKTDNYMFAEMKVSSFNTYHENNTKIRMYYKFEDFVKSIENLVCKDTTIDVYISFDKYTDVLCINEIENIKNDKYMKLRFVIKNSEKYEAEELGIIEGKRNEIYSCKFRNGNDYTVLDYTHDEDYIDIEERTKTFLKIIYYNMRNNDYVINDFTDRYFIVNYT